MNIFVLDTDIETCARYHNDRHVVKMILESAQILCTVVAKHGGDSPYRPTHQNHPCTLWAGESQSNWLWLKKLGLALDEEYRYRYDKTVSNKSAEVIRGLSLPSISDRGLTSFAQAMPKPYRNPDNPVAAYRNYYRNEKAGLAQWTKRSIPHWWVTD